MDNGLNVFLNQGSLSCVQWSVPGKSGNFFPAQFEFSLYLYYLVRTLRYKFGGGGPKHGTMGNCWGFGTVITQGTGWPSLLVGSFAFPQCEQASWLGEVTPVFTQMLSRCYKGREEAVGFSSTGFQEDWYSPFVCLLVKYWLGNFSHEATHIWRIKGDFLFWLSLFSSCSFLYLKGQIH